jgi:hypothetical protein
MSHGIRNEEMARRFRKCAQHREVADPLLAQLLDETGAVAAEGIGAP